MSFQLVNAEHVLRIGCMHRCGNVHGQQRCGSDYSATEPHGSRVEVRGYFVDRPTMTLVSDMKWLLANTPIPEGEHVLLGGVGVERLAVEELYGAEVVVGGKLAMRQSIGSSS